MKSTEAQRRILAAIRDGASTWSGVNDMVAGIGPRNLQYETFCRVCDSCVSAGWVIEAGIESVDITPAGRAALESK